MFENIPGFETISLNKATRLVNQLWSMYRGHKKAKTPEASSEKPVELIIANGVITKPEPQSEVSQQWPDAAKPVVAPTNKALFDLVVAEGLDFIKAGKSKADAARAIYASLKEEPKEVIVAAFVAGATLTEKGALTYWYNCKRKAAKA